MKIAPLRHRVAIAVGLMGFGLSLGFAALTDAVAEDYEDILVDVLLRAQGEAYLDELAARPATRLPRHGALGVYRQSEAPSALRHLSAGSHEVLLPGHEGVHAAVVERGQARLVVVLEVGRIERMEQYLQELMLAVVVGGTLLSGWLGWLLAARSIRPVRELALSVEALPDRPAPTGLASRYGADEVGRLAAAIDGFQRRLSTADDRERQFFADASHELRTPITVIQGAVEVLEDDPLASADQRQKFARIERSVFELASLIEAVLLSARKLPDEHSPIDLASLCREVLATLEGRHPGLAARLRVVGAGPTALHGPLRWATSLLTVLFHRVLTAFPDARWIAELSDEGLLLRQAPGGAAGGAPAVVRSDLGIGLVFADRLARVLGWRLHQDTGSEDGLRLRLSV